MEPAVNFNEPATSSLSAESEDVVFVVAEVAGVPCGAVVVVARDISELDFAEPDDTAPLDIGILAWLVTYESQCQSLL